MQTVDTKLITGIVQSPGYSWPGIFIDGAQAATYALFLEALLEKKLAEGTTELTDLAELGLREFIDLLNKPRDAYHKEQKV